MTVVCLRVTFCGLAYRFGCWLLWVVTFIWLDSYLGSVVCFACVCWCFDCVWWFVDAGFEFIAVGYYMLIVLIFDVVL